MDLFQKAYDYEDVTRLRESGLYNYFRTLDGGQNPVVSIGGRNVIMLGSNNYLGLTSHPKVKEAAAIAAARYGAGCAGSRLLNGTLDLHVRLEERLAEFFGFEAAIVFATGYQANLGALSSLLGRHDVAFLDQLDHACIIDGCRLGFGKLLRFRHNDIDDLDSKLRHSPEKLGKLIVADGLFSMEGDLANLEGLVRLKKEYGARLMVDDAHGIGVLGEHGRGTAEELGQEEEVDLLMGTFSKALATVGGFVAANRTVIDFIRHQARSLIFSASLPPPSAAAALQALDIIEAEPELRQRVRATAAYMNRELRLLGFDTLQSVTPVIPLLMGDDLTAFQMTNLLYGLGVFVNPVISPAVPPGGAMVRTSYMATHTAEQLDVALEAFEKAGREVGVLS